MSISITIDNDRTSNNGIQNLIEDVLAEHLLLGRYEPGTTIVVDRDGDGGLVMSAQEQKTPVEVA